MSHESSSISDLLRPNEWHACINIATVDHHTVLGNHLLVNWDDSVDGLLVLHAFVVGLDMKGSLHGGEVEPGGHDCLCAAWKVVEGATKLGVQLRMDAGCIKEKKQSKTDWKASLWECSSTRLSRSTAKASDRGITWSVPHVSYYTS